MKILFQNALNFWNCVILCSHFKRLINPVSKDYKLTSKHEIDMVQNSINVNLGKLKLVILIDKTLLEMAIGS